MPIRKVSKKPIRKIKRVIKKKTHSKSNVSKVTKALASVSIHHNKLLSSLFDSIYFELRGVTESDRSLPASTAFAPGYIQLSLDTSTAAAKELPLHLWDLTSVINDTSSSYCPALCMKYESAEYPFFQTIGAFPSWTLLGANDGGAFSTSQSLNRTMQNYFDVRLELFPRDKYNTEYTVTLLKIKDANLLPQSSAVAGDYAKGNAFWKQMARPYYTNSLVPGDPRIMSDLQGKYKILWEKKYKLRERLSDADSYKGKKIKIFRMLNQINHYNEAQEAINYAGDDPATTTQGTLAGNATPKCKYNERVYLMIRANATVDKNATGWDSATPTSVDVPNYNIYIKTKHTVPQAGV